MARFLVWRAAWMADRRIPNSKEASMCKAYAGGLLMKVTAAGVIEVSATGAPDSVVSTRFDIVDLPCGSTSVRVAANRTIRQKLPRPSVWPYPGCRSPALRNQDTRCDDRPEQPL